MCNKSIDFTLVDLTVSFMNMGPLFVETQPCSVDTLSLPYRWASELLTNINGNVMKLIFCIVISCN